MAEIDVDDVLDDPDFQDCFQLIRSIETVDKFGRAVDSNPFPLTLVGIIQPASGQTLQLMPDATRMMGVIEIWTRYALQGETDTTSPDTIIWQGKHYIVNHTDPWLSWGDGFVHAVCTRKEITEASKLL